MIILAFDLATATGCAFGDANGAPTFQTERLSEPGAPHGRRFRNTMGMTKRLIKRVNPDVVVIEEAIASGGGGAQSRIQLAMGDRAAVMIICDQMGFKVREYAVPSIRKHFIGHGRLRRDVAKARTIARCRSLGWNVKNDNEADACAVWEFARAKLTGMASMPKGLFDARSEELQSKRG